MSHGFFLYLALVSLASLIVVLITISGLIIFKIIKRIKIINLKKNKQADFFEYSKNIIIMPQPKKVVDRSKQPSINQWVKFNGQYQKILTNDGIKERFIIPNIVIA